MGLYQLSRLHYCFANDKIHSNKGYPKWLFISMIISGILLMMSWFTLLMLNGQTDGLNINCGINANFEYYYSRYNPDLLKNDTWVAITAYSYNVWDITTLLLYIFKIRLFNYYKNNEPIVYKRILSILYKIVIITLFYQIISFIISIPAIATKAVGFEANLLALFTNSVLQSATALGSYSMYLMMDYNVKGYVKFLRVIHYLKLHFICCKYRSMVVDQLSELDKNVQRLSVDVATNTMERQRRIEDETKITVNDQKIATNGNELSVETM